MRRGVPHVGAGDFKTAVRLRGRVSKRESAEDRTQSNRLMREEGSPQRGCSGMLTERKTRMGDFDRCPPNLTALALTSATAPVRGSMDSRTSRTPKPGPAAHFALHATSWRRTKRVHGSLRIGSVRCSIHHAVRRNGHRARPGRRDTPLREPHRVSRGIEPRLTSSAHPRAASNSHPSSAVRSIRLRAVELPASDGWS